MNARPTAFWFFFDNAGWSYHPAHESELAGRTRCALELAYAEAVAAERGLGFEWEYDDIDSSEFSARVAARRLWQCLARTPGGEVLASLSGIDLGRPGTPDKHGYRRVVEAELADEALDLGVWE